MKKATRYVKYEFTCAANHINRREELIEADTVDEAVTAIKKKQLVCDYCFEEPTDRSQVVVAVNDLMVLPDEDE